MRLQLAFVLIVTGVLGVVYFLSLPDPVSTAMPASAPAVGSCWAVSEEVVAQSAHPWPSPAVDCAVPHTAEVFHRARVSADLVQAARDAEGPDRTIAISLMYASARRDCSVLASDFLDGDWHSGRVQVLATWIDPPASGFFACALAETSDPAAAHFVSRKGTLSGSAAALAIGCVARVDGGTAYAACDRPHAGEFVGAYTILPGNAPFVESAVRDAANQGCADLTRRFLELPADTSRSDLRIAYVGPLSATDWLGSDQTFACYAMADTVLTATVKGLVTGPLPS